MGSLRSPLLLLCLVCVCVCLRVDAFLLSTTRDRRSVHHLDTKLLGKITPRENEGMDDYRKAVVNTLNANKSDGSFGGREILELLVKKWGVGTSGMRMFHLLYNLFLCSCSHCLSFVKFPPCNLTFSPFL